MSLTIKDMLLIEEPTVRILKDELMTVTGWFILPSFVFALVLEYFGEMRFLEVVKKLILILVFIGSFYSFHSEGVSLSLKGSEEILKKVSPNNIFLRKWTQSKVKTNESGSWSALEKFAIPNINDLVGTMFFLMSKVFIWILKLVYSTVYHLTYVFAPLTAILYFFPITKGSIGGTIQSSLWCMFMPIVLVSILAIVGNSIQAPAGSGELAIVSIDHILWLFGVTFLLLLSPVLTLGILRGGGVAMAGSAVGAMMANSAMKVLRGGPGLASGMIATSKKAKNIGSKALLEPSIRDLLKNESAPDKDKLKLLNQKGGIINPFRSQVPVDERLEKIGMTKNEAQSLARLPISKAINSNGEKIKENVPNLKGPVSTPLQKPFSNNKSFWNQITPEHKAELRKKYGLTYSKSLPNEIHHPESLLRGSQVKQPTYKAQALSTIQRPEQRKETQPVTESKLGAKSEV